jgi:hypothetical protein
MPKIITLKTPPCPGCKIVRGIAVLEDDYARWKAGALIQKAFPRMSASDREALITGYCDECWNRLIVDPVDEALSKMQGKAGNL